MTNNLIIGIDLGTTFSVIAKIDTNGLGKPEVIANAASGEALTPSTICFYGDEPEVGKAAKESCEDNAYLATEFKRGMGQKDYSFKAKDKQYSAIDLSEIVLRELKRYASEYIDEEVKDVVISVPARFHELEREATIKAGQQAGLNILAIINEPTAAAIYYAQKTNTNGTVLIYDLGGGTFDVYITPKL